MNLKLKHILVLWRVPLYAFVLNVILFALAVFVKSEDASGALSALALFVAFPLLVFVIVRAIVLSVRKASEYDRYGLPDEVTLPEVEFFKRRAESIKDCADEYSTLSPGMKARFIIFRLLAVLLVPAGIVLALCGLYIIGTLVIIGGVTLWITARPGSYNSRVSGVRMVACPDDTDVNDLFEKLKNEWTPLGTPYLAKMDGYPTDVIVYGPDAHDDMIVVYPAKSGGHFFVSTAFFPEKITERLTEPAQPVGESYALTDDGLDNDTMLDLVAQKTLEVL